MGPILYKLHITSNTVGVANNVVSTNSNIYLKAGVSKRFCQRST